MLTNRNISESILQKMDEIRDGESRLSQAIPPCAIVATSSALRDELKGYAANSSDRVRLIHQALVNLSYLLGQYKNRVIDKLVSNTKEMLTTLDSDQMRDALMASCIQTINDHKITGYTNIVDCAIQLGNDELVTTFQKILDQEIIASRNLKTIAAQIQQQA